MNYFAKQYNRSIFRMLLTENVIFKRLPVKHGTGNPGMEWGMEWNGEWNGMGNGITRNCKSRNL